MMPAGRPEDYLDDLDLRRLMGMLPPGHSSPGGLEQSLEGLPPFEPTPLGDFEGLDPELTAALLGHEVMSGREFSPAEEEMLIQMLGRDPAFMLTGGALEYGESRNATGGGGQQGGGRRMSILDALSTQPR